MGFNAAVLQRLQTTRPDTVESRWSCAPHQHSSIRSAVNRASGAAIEKGC